MHKFLFFLGRLKTYAQNLEFFGQLVFCQPEPCPELDSRIGSYQKYCSQKKLLKKRRE